MHQIKYNIYCIVKSTSNMSECTACAIQTCKIWHSALDTCTSCMCGHWTSPPDTHSPLNTYIFTRQFHLLSFVWGTQSNVCASPPQNWLSSPTVVSRTALSLWADFFHCMLQIGSSMDNKTIGLCILWQWLYLRMHSTTELMTFSSCFAILEDHLQWCD